VKRLSHRWMALAGVAYMDWTEHYDGPAGIQNPTRTDGSAGGLAGPLEDGGQVAVPGTSALMTARWQLTANALYQLPWEVEVSGSLFARQGYAAPTILRLPAGEDGTLRVLVAPHLTDGRLASLWNLDLRLARNVRLAGDGRIVVSVDLFNVFNRALVLSRDTTATAVSYGRANEVINPRVLRVGARLDF